VHQANGASDQNTKSLRISIDSKAKVKIGNLSRNGKSRSLEAKIADDHDLVWSALLVPFGILNLQTNKLSIYFGSSAETSDFIVDCLSQWWEENKHDYEHIEELLIDLDGGSATRSNRTQFIKRMVELAKKIGIKIRLIYYPPYHSKYNPIERCWAALEKYWNGAILDSIETAVQWAKNMTWKGVKPIVNLMTATYEKKINVAPNDMIPYQDFWIPSQTLPKWDVMVIPY
jgi:Rhodopirellula transposase DDE domain